MTTRVVLSSACEYAQALVPHLEHESYRCDRPWQRLMGKGCRTCDLEIVIGIPEFKASGDLEAFEREMKPHQKKPAKKA